MAQMACLLPLQDFDRVIFEELKDEDESPISLRPHAPWFFSLEPMKRAKQPELPRISSPALSEDSGFGEETPELPLSQIPTSASSQSEESVENLQDPEDKYVEELLQSFRSILNKLTPEKFDQLMGKVNELRIDTMERIRRVAELVHEKAISEPSLSVTYSSMCRHMANLRVASKPSKSKSSFKSILLRFCLEQLDKDQEKEDGFAIKQKEMEAAPAGEQEILRQELAETRVKARRCSIGNINFIVELYKQKMLKETIIHECLTKSLKQHDDETLECLCKLLTTVGKELDVGEGKIQLDEYIHQMETLMKEHKTSTRICSMMHDVMDLRLNQWVPRGANLGPKTITRIHEEAQMEEEMELQKVSRPLFKELKDEDESPISLRPHAPWFFSPAPMKMAKQPELPRISSPALSEDSGFGEETPELPLSQIPTSASSQSEESVENLQYPEVKNVEELLQSFRSILNKLTPEKFDQLMGKVNELRIDTMERIRRVAELVHEKAISEPSLSVTYSSMCRHMANLRVPSKPSKSKSSFKSILLRFCWEQLDKDQEKEDGFAIKQKEMEAAPAGEQEILRQELAEVRVKARRCSIGNVNFIVELYKQKMLKETIIHECLTKSLKQHDDETLECLCKLLTTVGKELDVGEGKIQLDEYIHQMETLMKEHKTSTRICSMMHNVMDLRLNQWVPRSANLGPKTITQIPEEAQMEEEMEQQKVIRPLFKELKDEDESPISLRPHAPWFFSPAPMKKAKQPELPRISSPALSEDSGFGEETPELPLSQIPTSDHFIDLNLRSSQSEQSVENLRDSANRNPEMKYVFAPVMEMFLNLLFPGKELLQNVSAILDKLSPETFNHLMTELTELHIDTEEQLSCIIEMVYKKAVSEPSSSGSYASMCRRLATLRVPMKNKHYIDVGFKSLLLQFCWKQIEKDQDTGKQQQRCSLNTIKFFIELFKQKLLTEAIMHECVVKLLKQHNGKTLECLCHLLTSVGKEMDVGEAKSKMDAHFTQLKNLVKEQKSASKRIRNMIKDVLVLRMNDWVPQETKQQKVCQLLVTEDRPIILRPQRLAHSNRVHSSAPSSSAPPEDPLVPQMGSSNREFYSAPPHSRPR